MAQPTSPLAPEAVFRSTLLDQAGQPNLVFGSSQSNQLNWTLTNNATKSGQDLLVTPFTSGPVSPTQYHFSLYFAPGTLTAVPSIPGWTVAVELDSRGAIQTAYLGAEAPITIAPQGSKKVAELAYTTAIQEDPNNSQLAVTITAGKNVTLGGASIEGKLYGPFHLTLVPAGAPTLSDAPISVDFVGRRTVLNDGKTPNSFTFALTNMTSADLVLTPQPKTVADSSSTVLTVWFDAAPNNPEHPSSWAWALAQVQHLDARSVQLAPDPPSSNWKVAKSPTEYSTLVAGNPQWALTVSSSVTLAPQSPLLFTFSGIVSDLDPGFTRMYLRFQNLGSFAPGILVAELEKSPLLYGITRGQGLYLSAGTPQGNTPPALNYGSGLCVNQFGDAPAATFNGGNVGIGNTDPKNKLHIGSGKSTITHDRVSVVIATKARETGIAIAQEGGSLGPVNLLLQASDAGAYIGTTSNHSLVLRTRDADRVSIDNDGILTANSTHIALRTSDADRVSIDKDGTLTANGTHIALKTSDADRVSIDKDGTLTANGTHIVLKTSDADRVSIDKDGALTANGTHIVLRTSDADRVSIDKDGNVGIGTNTPGFPLSFPNKLGDKISLWEQTGTHTHFGFGIQDGLLQIHANASTDDIAFGYGKSDSFTETMRIRGNQNLSVGDGLFIQGRPGTDTGSLTKNAFINPAGNWQIKDTNKKAFTVELRDSGMLELYGTVTQGQTDWRKMATFDAPNNYIEFDAPLYVNGSLTYYWGVSDGTAGWYNIQNRAGNWAGSLPTSGPPCDFRLKTELRPIPSALEKVSQLRGVTFHWNEQGLQYLTRDIATTVSAGPGASDEENRKVWQAERDKRYKDLSKTSVGVVAQDVEAVLPEAVTADETGYKSVKYHELIPLIIEGLKELNKVSQEQAQTIARQQAEIQRLTAANQAALQQLQELQEVRQKLGLLEATVNKFLLASGG